MKTIGHLLIAVGSIPFILLLMVFLNNGVESLKLLDLATFKEFLALISITVIQEYDIASILVLMLFFASPIFILVGTVILRAEGIKNKREIKTEGISDKI